MGGHNPHMVHFPKRSTGWVIVERWYPNLEQGYREETRSAVFSTEEAAANFAATLNPIHHGGLLHVVALSELQSQHPWRVASRQLRRRSSHSQTRKSNRYKSAVCSRVVMRISTARFLC